MKNHYIKNGESLRIDAEHCIGCGACIDVCPHEVFALKDRTSPFKAVIQDRKACMECGACANNCPTGAISVESGVGCAAAVLQSIKKKSTPECGCSSGSNCCS